MKNYLYLFRQEKFGHFKLGITQDIKTRKATLEKDWGPCDVGSCYFELEDALEAEKDLQLFFEDFRIPANIMRISFGGENGASEFFKIRCYFEIIECIQANYHILDFDYMEGSKRSIISHIETKLEEIGSQKEELKALRMSQNEQNTDFYKKKYEKLAEAIEGAKQYINNLPER